MKLPRLLFIIAALASSALAQTAGVTKSLASASLNEITGDIVFPSGKTLTVNGTLSGTPAGGTLNLSAVTLTPPSNVVTLTGSQTLTNKTLTSPLLTTPNIGAATGTSVNLSGAGTFGGNLTVSGQIRAPYTADGAPGFSFSPANDIGISSFDGTSLRFAVAGTRRFLMSSDSTLYGEGNASSLRLASTGFINLTAGGTNQNITLTPSGTGIVSVSGNLTVAGTTLTVGGAVGIVKSLASADLELQTTTAGTNVKIRPGGGTVATFAESGQTTLAGNLTVSGGTVSVANVTGSGALGSLTVSGTNTATGALTLKNTSGNSNYAGITIGVGTNTGGIAFLSNSGSVATERMRLSDTNGNFLIGGTTDISGSGGLKVFGTTASTSTTSGALQVAGGVGVAGAIYAGGSLTLSGATSAITCGSGGVVTTGSVTAGAGGGFANPSWLIYQSATPGQLYIRDTVNGVMTAYFTAGAGVTGAMNLNGNLTVSGTTASTSTSTGALVVSGGVGVAGNIYSGGAMIASGTSTSTGYNNNANAQLEGPSGRVIINHINGQASGTLFAGFGYNGSGLGSITQDGTSAVLYNTTSDARLKENVRDVTNSGAIIDGLKPRVFDWKKNGDKDRFGFLAQEVHAVFPQAVKKGDDGEEVTDAWAMDAAKLVPVLVAELKALRARVAALEAAQVSKP